MSEKCTKCGSEIMRFANNGNELVLDYRSQMMFVVSENARDAKVDAVWVHSLHESTCSEAPHQPKFYKKEG